MYAYNRSRAKKCEFCGMEVRAKVSSAKYCSRECYGKAKTARARASWPDKVCPVCNVVFKSRERGAIYCSRECWSVSEKGEDKHCGVCEKLMPWNSPYTCCSVKCAGFLRRRENKARSTHCLHCGIYIFDGEHTFKFCSTQCAYDYRSAPDLENQSCRECGVKIISNKVRVFCGTECQGKWNKVNLLPFIKPGRITKECLFCNEEFYRPDKNVKFCGRKCYIAYRSARTREKNTKACVFCNKDFVADRGGRKFCSQQCFINSRSKKKPKRKTTTVMRGGMTPVEFEVWLALEGSYGEGVWYHSFRVAPFGDVPDRSFYLLDFVHLPLKINIEIDGREHQFKREEDRVRDEWLVSQGWTVLRFSNQEILDSIDLVMEKIQSVVMT